MQRLSPTTILSDSLSVRAELGIMNGSLEVDVMQDGSFSKVHEQCLAVYLKRVWIQPTSSRWYRLSSHALTFIYRHEDVAIGRQGDGQDVLSVLERQRP